MNNIAQQLSQQLESSIEQLDDTQVSWINKHYVIDLQNKGLILLSSIVNVKDKAESHTILDGVKEYIAVVQPIIKQIKNKEL